MKTSKKDTNVTSLCKADSSANSKGHEIFQQLVRGQTGPLIKYAIILFLIFLSGRLAMLTMYWKRVESVSLIPSIFLGGFVTDISIILLLLLPLVLHFSIPSEEHMRKWIIIPTIYSLFTLMLASFLEVSGLAYSVIFECRPNRIFFEYLAFPKEVFSTVAAGFPISGLIILISTFALPLVLFSTVRQHMTSFSLSSRKLLVLSCFIYVSLFAMLSLPVVADWTNLFSYSTVTSDRVLNNIAMNSFSSSICGILTMVDRELDGSKFYGSISESELLERVSTYSSTTIMKESEAISSTTTNDRPDSLLVSPADPAAGKKLNIVIIVEESLSACFCGHLGGKNLTPELDKLVREGTFFSSMYSNGDRTVRGLEAVACGILPTAGRGITKQTEIPDRFFSLGRVLKNRGYITEFIYGGDRNFDYMWRFFNSVGFDHVYDEKNCTDKDVFHGPWGICDGDLFDRACKIFDSHNGKPFASLILTTSIHDPFSYPKGVAEVSGPPATAENAVRYGDKVLGNFFARAKKSSWYKDTIFVFVSDHNLRVAGPGLIPVEAFHIPAFIIGPGVPVKEYKEICHQIDLVPTILNLLDVETEIPLLGSNLLQTHQEKKQSNRAFIMTGYTAALFNDKSMVVLNPGTPPVGFVRTGSFFTLTKNLDNEMAKDCLSFVLSTNVLFKSPEYRVRETLTCKVTHPIEPLN